MNRLRFLSPQTFDATNNQLCGFLGQNARTLVEATFSFAACTDAEWAAFFPSAGEHIHGRR